MENKDVKFIGKGKQIGNKIQISFEWETLKKAAKHDYEGKKYLTIDVIKMKETGKFGHTHTVVEHVHLEKSDKQ